jgi:hypothetical protein
MAASAGDYHHNHPLLGLLHQSVVGTDSTGDPNYANYERDSLAAKYSRSVSL